MAARLDITGQRFGSLVAIEPTDKRSDNKVIWRCLCDCGKEVFVKSSDLKSGDTKSCGDPIHRIKGLTGKRFGRLTVVGDSGKRTQNNNIVWHCVCDCGNEVDVRGTSLTTGNTKSCGCLNHDPKPAPPDTMDGTRATALNQTIPSTNTSGIRGVSWDKRSQKWAAYIKYKGYQYHLGKYDNIEDARDARKKAESMLYDEFLDYYTEQILNRDRGVGRPAKNIRGMKFGKLTPLFPTGQRKNTSMLWRCQCDCGEMITVKLNHLTTGHTTCCQKCGKEISREKARRYDAPREITHPKATKDLTGTRYGFLRAVSPTDKRLNGNVVWIVACDCGRRIRLDSAKLRSYAKPGHRLMSCGCTVKRGDRYLRKCSKCGKNYAVIPGMLGTVCPKCRKK